MSSVVTLQYGKALVDENRRPGRVPVYGTNGRTGWDDQALASGPTVILLRKGMGNLGVEWSPGPFWVIDTAYFTTFDLDRVFPRFFYYFTNFVGLNHLKDGTSNPSLSRDTFARQWLPSAPLSQQVAISSILGLLDDKIALNRRMNETLEAMARAIFKDWLHSNEPTLVRSRVSELVAKGILKVGDGYRAKNDELGSPGLPFIRAGELNNGFDIHGANVLHEKSLPSVGEKVSRNGNVAFTSKGTIGRFARVSKQTPNFVYSPQVCFWRSINTQLLRPSVLYAWMVSDDLKLQIDAVSGKTDMAPYVSLSDQRAMTMPEFGPEQHDVADKIDPLLELQDANQEENRTLAATRDLLLPKLMSGEIRVKDAETIVEAVA